MTTTRVAAIDCGTNTTRLLVADRTHDGLTDVTRVMRVTRLGAGVDTTGLLDPEAIERTLAVLADYAATIAELGATRVRMVATSASRDAANRDVFVAGVRRVLGVDPEVVPGEVEAQLSFAGATAGIARTASAQPPYLVVDIGGGSTEFVLGETGAARVAAAVSMDIGCVRMTERHLRADPPTDAQIVAATGDIDAAIEAAAATVPLAAAGTLIGVAGSVTTLAAIALDLPAYDPIAIHGSTLTAINVAAITARLLAMPRADRAAIPVMHPGRVDIIGAGALILDRIVRAVGVDRLLVSEHDILDGIAASIAE